MRRIKVIYGDGTTERYCVNVSYAEALELARRQARKQGTYVRGFSCVRILQKKPRRTGIPRGA